MASTSKLTPSTSNASLASGSFTKPATQQPAPIGVGLKTDANAEREMRLAIRDLVASADPYVRLDAEAEDMLLTVASEFLESTTNFAARLARHRGSDSLDVKDLQLHFERHHSIRVPGFATTDDIGKVPAFPGQQPSSTGGATGASSTTQQQQQGASGAGSGTAAGGSASIGAQSAANTAANAGAGASGKGKEKAPAAAAHYTIQAPCGGEAKSEH